MTRKDYELIAGALRTAKPSYGTARNRQNLSPAMLQWRIDCRSIALELATENPVFKRDVFFKACGLTDE